MFKMTMMSFFVLTFFLVSCNNTISVKTPEDLDPNSDAYSSQKDGENLKDDADQGQTGSDGVISLGLMSPSSSKGLDPRPIIKVLGSKAGWGYSFFIF